MDRSEGPLNLQLPIEERSTRLRSSLLDLEVADSDTIASGLESHPSADHSKGRILPLFTVFKNFVLCIDSTTAVGKRAAHKIGDVSFEGPACGLPLTSIGI